MEEKEICKFTKVLSIFAIKVGLVLHIIGLSLSNWSKDNYDDSSTKGLWEQSIRAYYDLAYVRPIRAFVIIAMILGLAGVTLLWVFVATKNKPSFYIGMATTIFSTALIYTSLILWSVNVQAELHDWHFSTGWKFSLGGGVVMAVAVVLLVITYIRPCQKDETSPESNAENQI